MTPMLVQDLIVHFNKQWMLIATPMLKNSKLLNLLKSVKKMKKNN